MAPTRTTKIYHLGTDQNLQTVQAAPDLAQPFYVSHAADLSVACATLIFDVSRSTGPLLCGLGFPAEKPAAWGGFMARFPGVRACAHQAPPVVRAVQQATEGLLQGAPPPLKLTGTPFQHRVWQALLSIPEGASDTYGGLAAKLGSSPRAVGGAVGANQLAWLVPCHRILGADGKLHGYRWGLAVKARLLAAERVSFSG
ncbi:MAG: methylated-DNA--[protein]-cysteine S-methyltransferase [Parvibaculales bacterium]